MNFKNISLFIVLFATNFTGTVIHADVENEFEATVTVNNKMKMKIDDIKLKALDALNELHDIYERLGDVQDIYFSILQACKKACINIKLKHPELTDDSIEICKYQDRIYYILYHVQKAMTSVMNARENYYRNEEDLLLEKENILKQIGFEQK